MILVDSSVFIEWSRGKDPALDQLFITLSIATCGIVQAEVLSGS